MTSSLKPFYFLRHGETEWNKLRLYTGSRDIPLNHIGEQQALNAANILKNKNITHIVTSPLARATKTAEIINKTLETKITVIEELTECCWGEYEEQPYNNQGFLQKWLEGNHFNGVEHVHHFEKRVLSGLNIALELWDPVLIISHGAVYAAIQRLFKLATIRIKNCCPLFHEPLLIKQTYTWSVHEIEN